jgi:hypothetical protein
VLQEKRLGAVTGRGPNALGQQNDFSPTLEVFSGVGHSWDESNVVVKDSFGVWFRDPDRGLRHLGRGLQVTEIQIGDTVAPAGSEVDDLEDSFTGAAVWPAKKQIRFFGEASVLVWDYENKQWSQFDSDEVTAISGGVVASNMVFLATVDGTVEVLNEESGETLDNESIAIEASLVTAWLRLAELLGFQRVYRAGVLGQYTGDGASQTFECIGTANLFGGEHTIAIDYATNIDAINAGAIADGDTIVLEGETYTVLSVDSVSDAPVTISIYVDAEVPLGVAPVDFTVLKPLDPVAEVSLEVGHDYSDEFDDPLTYDVIKSDTNRTFQFQHHLEKQKCESVRFRITVSSSLGKVRLSGMSLQIGSKRGLFKISGSNNI